MKTYQKYRKRDFVLMNAAGTQRVCENPNWELQIPVREYRMNISFLGLLKGLDNYLTFMLIRLIRKRALRK